MQMFTDEATREAVFGRGVTVEEARQIFGELALSWPGQAKQMLEDAQGAALDSQIAAAAEAKRAQEAVKRREDELRQAAKHRKTLTAELDKALGCAQDVDRPRGSHHEPSGRAERRPRRGAASGPHRARRRGRNQGDASRVLHARRAEPEAGPPRHGAHGARPARHHHPGPRARPDHGGCRWRPRRHPKGDRMTPEQDSAEQAAADLDAFVEALGDAFARLRDATAGLRDPSFPGKALVQGLRAGAPEVVRTLSKMEITRGVIGRSVVGSLPGQVPTETTP